MKSNSLLEVYLKYVVRKAEYAGLDKDYFLGKDFSSDDYQLLKQLRDRRPDKSLNASYSQLEGRGEVLHD